MDLDLGPGLGEHHGMTKTPQHRQLHMSNQPLATHLERLTYACHAPRPNKYCPSAQASGRIDDPPGSRWAISTRLPCRDEPRGLSGRTVLPVGLQVVR